MELHPVALPLMQAVGNDRHCRLGFGDRDARVEPATTCRLWLSRTLRSSTVKARGIHPCVDAGNHNLTENCVGITPMIL